jgi:selenide,water dikinase
MDERLPSRDIVLVGAGHTNMHIVRMWRMNPLPDTRLTLVSPFSRATYSGMLPGTLAGLYEPEEMEIDLWRFVAPSGIRLIIDEAVRVDGDTRCVHFRERPSVRFDVASVGVGSMPAGGDRWSSIPSCLAIKPMTTFRQRLAERLDALHKSGRGISTEAPVRAVVVGGGAAGVEICLCLDAFLRRAGVVAEVSLVDSRPSILGGYLPGTIRRVTDELSRRGIRLKSAVRVETVGADSLRLSHGESLPVDVVIWSTGAAPPPLIQNCNLPKADDGFLAVDRYLQSTSGAPVFAVGDSASLLHSPVAKSGVYAVREGPFLWNNLRRFLRNQPLKPYFPQSGFLSLLADGDGGAFLNYKRIAASGRWCWKYKDHIDRKFMRMFQDYRPMVATSAAGTAAIDLVPQMRCRGCGGKAAANVLHAAFERLRDSSAVSCAASSTIRHRAFEAAEDAARLDPQVGTPDLISVDVFQPFIDDPWFVGRIAALNSLSDLWATGGRPTGALATVQLPVGSPQQQSELLTHLLAGSLAEFNTANVGLLGGHTIEGAELSIGFTVVGTLDGEPCLQKAGLKPDDLLVLTKPLGTGVLLAGIPQARTCAAWVDQLQRVMMNSNRHAAEVARSIGASAVTDVTGFGLAGHLFEMLDASGVSAELSLQSLPLLDGFSALVAAGVESTLAPANRSIADRITVQNERLIDTPEWHALFDPQTSGGLLVGISSNELAALKAAAQAGFGVYVVGRVTAVRGSQPSLLVRD